MNMVDLYVNEVGKHLPEKNRADLQQEIRSLIEDAIEDAAQAQNREPDEALIVDVLKKFGAPERVAASYGKPQFLIGPKLFPTFWMVLRIVLAVVLVLAALGVGLQLGRDTAQSPFEMIATVFGSVLGALVSAFGNVVLVFAILERLLPESAWPAKQDWDPRSLKAEPNPEQVKMAEPIVGTVFTLALLLVLNVYPQWMGMFSIVDGRWVSAPLLAPVFFRYLPWINILLVSEIVLNSLLLQQGRWTNTLRWLGIVRNMASVALLAWMLSGPAILQIDPVALSQLGWNTATVEAFAQAGPALVTLSRMILGISLAANVLEALGKLYRIFTGKTGFNPIVLQ